jgi:copper chaperone CopZ
MRHLRLSIPGMGCRRCVREVTGRLRDVPGVETVVADAAANTVVLSGTMAARDVLSAFDGSGFAPLVVPRACPALEVDRGGTATGKSPSQPCSRISRPG